MRRRSWQVHNEVFSRCNGFITCIVPTTRHTREQDTRTIRGHTPNPRSPTHTHATEIDSGWPFSYLRHINQSRTSHTTYVRKQQAEVHDHSTSMEEWLGNYQLTQELTTIERPEPRYRGLTHSDCASSRQPPADGSVATLEHMTPTPRHAPAVERIELHRAACIVTHPLVNERATPHSPPYLWRVDG